MRPIKESVLRTVLEDIKRKNMRIKHTIHNSLNHTIVLRHPKYFNPVHVYLDTINNYARYSDESNSIYLELEDMCNAATKFLKELIRHVELAPQELNSEDIKSCAATIEAAIKGKLIDSVSGEIRNLLIIRKLEMET